MRPADTSPEAWRGYEETLRRMTPGERLAYAFELSTLLFERTETVLKLRYPEASDREIFLRRARISLGQELFVRVYGPVLDYDGRDDNLMEEIQSEMERNRVEHLLRRTFPDEPGHTV